MTITAILQINWNFANESLTIHLGTYKTKADKINGTRTIYIFSNTMFLLINYMPTKLTSATQMMKIAIQKTKIWLYYIFNTYPVCSVSKMKWKFAHFSFSCFTPFGFWKKNNIWFSCFCGGQSGSINCQKNVTRPVLNTIQTCRIRTTLSTPDINN